VTQKLHLTEGQREILRHLPPGLKKKIRSALEAILENPAAGKPLRETLQGLRSYRIGNFRVVYRMEGYKIVLVDVGPRKTIYQKVVLELKQQRRS